MNEILWIVLALLIALFIFVVLVAKRVSRVYPFREEKDIDAIYGPVNPNETKRTKK